MLFLALTSFMMSCGEMKKANKLVEDSNAAVKAGEKYAEEADAKLKELDNGRAGFPSNRSQLEAPAKEALDLLDKAAVKLREAAANYETAGQAKIDDKLREYLALKSKEFSKHVEHLEAAKDIPKAIMDPSIDGVAALNSRRAEINGRIEKLKNEWEDLAARAKKIREENKDKFES